MEQRFIWDEKKSRLNADKHGLSFDVARRAFDDKNSFYSVDELHSTTSETRYFHFGKIDGEIVTVVFTIRGDKIRIISAGYYRKGRRIYEERNK
jgi:uncharacterized DUF497 family protein